MGVCVGPQNVRKFVSIGKSPEGSDLIGPEMPIERGVPFASLWLNSRVAPSLLFLGVYFLLS